MTDSSEDEKPIKKAKKAGGKAGAKKVGKVAAIVESDDDDEATVLPSNTATLKSATIAGKAYSTVKERIQHIGFNQELHDKLVDFVCSDEYYERRSRYGQDDEQGDDDNAIDGMDDEGEEDAAPKKKPTAGQTTLTGAKKVGKAGTTYTPLEKQYLDIKAKYPDTILFVESGYKYCFFGKDAEVASKVLSIMAGMGKHFIQTSIPVHRLHVHARRLVQAGYKVGVVTQTETAALKKASTNKSGPFARALTSMYTKSTLVGGDMDPLSSNDAGVGVYLMGITESPVPSAAGSSDPSRVAISIVAVKTSTGDIIYDHFEDNFMRNELDSRLRHIQPVELLLPDSLAGPTRKLVELYKQQTASSITGKDNEARLEYAPATRFDADRAREQISATMKLTASMTATSTPIVVEAGDTPSAEEEMSSLLDQLPDQVVGLVGALMIYLKDFGLSGLFCLSMNYRSFTKAGHMRLDGSALANLELIRNQTDNSFRGSLLWVIDHTRTIFGRRMLMQWVQQPLVDVARITERLDAVAELALGGDIPIPLLNLYEKLANLPDLERGLCKVYYNKCGFDEFRTLLRAFKTCANKALLLSNPCPPAHDTKTYYSSQNLRGCSSDRHSRQDCEVDDSPQHSGFR
jgi:DNA mismatch repair protein MSH3